MLNQLRKERGFTIIELLIVIAIIGILATLVLTNFQGAQAKGRDTVRQNDINSLYQKLEEYYNENGGYPNQDITSANATTVFPGIDVGAVVDEQGNDLEENFDDSATLVTNPAPDQTNNQYVITLFGTGCDGATAANFCSSYRLAGFQEVAPGTAYVKNSLN